MNYFIQVFFIILPILVAGLLFIFSLKKNLFSFFRKPLDFNRTVFGKRIFGDNKTFRGIILMPVYVGLVVFTFGRFLEWTGVDLNKIVFDYSVTGWKYSLVYGLAFSLAELPNSFIKRQLAINPGQQIVFGWRSLFVLIDNIDSLLGCGIVLYFAYGIDWQYIIGALCFGFFIHLATDVFMRKLKLKD